MVNHDSHIIIAIPVYIYKNVNIWVKKLNSEFFLWSLSSHSL